MWKKGPLRSEQWLSGDRRQPSLQSSSRHGAREDGQALLLTLGSCRINMGIPEGSEPLCRAGGRAGASRAEGNRHRRVLGEDREDSLSKKRGARCTWRVLQAGKALGSRVALGAELERPRAGWAQEERGKILYMLLFSR